MKYKFQPHCTLCNKIPPKSNILYLKKLPITEILFKKPSRAKIFYDQKIKFCSECEHLSLTYLYDTAKFYNDSYMTSSTKLLIRKKIYFLNCKNILRIYK